MMDANELRIGNLIDYERTTHEIQSVDRYNATSYWLKHKNKAGDKLGVKILVIETVYSHPISLLKPIQLTDEWMLRFGFEKQKTTGRFLQEQASLVGIISIRSIFK